MGRVHDKRMHLRDVNGTEVSITVDVVDTTKELLEFEDSLLGSPKPHMVLTPGNDAHRMDGESRPPQRMGQPARGKTDPPQRRREEEQGSRRTSSISR
jgi:hypothetical protein